MLPTLSLKLLEYGTFCLGLVHVLCQRWLSDLVSKTLLGFIVILVWLFYVEWQYEHKSVRTADNYVRKSNGSGLWCTILLPMALVLSCSNSTLSCSATYKAISMLSWPLVITTISWLNYTIVDQPYKNFYVLNLIPLIVNPLIWFCCRINIDHVDLVIVSVIFHVMFWSTAQHLLFSSAKNFTLGEVIIFAQGCSIFAATTFINLKSKIMSAYFFGGATEFIQVCNIGAGLFVIVLLSIPQSRHPKGFFIMAATVGLGFIIPFSSYIIGENSLLWLANYVSHSPVGVMLMVHVVDLSILSIFVSALHRSSAGSTDRKWFHLLLGLAYLPAMAYHVELLYLMSGVVIGIFIIIECIRVVRFPPFGEFVHECCVTYVRHKNEGLLIVDHMHLLIGCSVPIWLYPTFTQDVSIAAYSGLISVVVGDSLAHVGGHLFGSHHWPDGKKTMEGTALSVLGQLTVFLFFLLLGYTDYSIWRFVTAITLSSLLESFTSQVDNTVLPFFLYSMLIS